MKPGVPPGMLLLCLVICVLWAAGVLLWPHVSLIDWSMLNH